jgi:signal transduction histidine kinase
MSTQTSSRRLLRLFHTLRREWREIGGLGRVAALALGASLAVAVALGFSITRAAEGHLLDAQTDLLQNVSRDLAVMQTPLDTEDSAQLDAFDSEVRLRLLGGETLTVKLWLRDGTIVYSDDGSLVGRRFEVSDPALAAFGGEASAVVVPTSDPAHAIHRDLGEVIEFYIPFGMASGGPRAVFEIEQRVDSLNAALDRIRRNVWLSIATGLSALGIFLTTLLVARTRDLNRRRKQAEELFGDLLHAQDEERRRVVGALHDDVGQPLYRLYYGLDGSLGRLEKSHPVREELEGMRSLVSDVDETLRAELRLLHEGLMADAGLEPALADLAEVTERESGMEVTTDYGVQDEPSDVPRTALYRAVREGVTNARRHSGATRVEISVVENGGTITAEVRDNGSGYAGRPGLGLTTTRERLEAIGGGLRVTAPRGGGTLYRVSVPARIEDVP